MGGTAKIAKLGDTLRGTRLSWYGHVKRLRKDYIGKRMIPEMAIPGKKRIGRPKRRWIDLEREDMEMVGAREEDEINRALWRRLSRCGNPK